MLHQGAVVINDGENSGVKLFMSTNALKCTHFYTCVVSPKNNPHPWIVKIGRY